MLLIDKSDNAPLYMNSRVNWYPLASMFSFNNSLASGHPQWPTKNPESLLTNQNKPRAPATLMRIIFREMTLLLEFGERLDLVLWETCHIYATCQAYRAEADFQHLQTS